MSTTSIAPTNGNTPHPAAGPDVELLDAAIDHIEANPTDWHQGTWTHCLAAVVATKISDGEWYGPDDPNYLVAVAADDIELGHKVHVEARARRLLRLHFDAHDFEPFGADVTLDQLRDFAADLRQRSGNPTSATA